MPGRRARARRLTLRVLAAALETVPAAELGGGLRTLREGGNRTGDHPPPTGAPVTACASAPLQHRRPGRRARSGWFVAIPVHIAGIIEREHAASTASRLLPQRTLLVQWKRKRKRGGDVFRSWITGLSADTPLAVLGRHATSRWYIETDYREMEKAPGLGDYEGWT